MTITFTIYIVIILIITYCLLFGSSVMLHCYYIDDGGVHLITSTSAALPAV